ncbi:MAG: NADH-quinone oxidoreductase subunit H [Bacteroidales bacterium]|nr:NADH-quinone oxidoreductase subunit H [Bacteroidales bacterium]
MAKDLLYYLIFPGFLFTALVGAIFSWIDRKVTAWVQFRKGPPFLQPFYDFFKLLLVKETILPARGSKMTFLFAPLLGLTGAALASMLILLPAIGTKPGFNGDIIVIFYILTIPSLTYIIGALAAGNPLASVGASREMKLIISYELTFLLILAAIIMKAGMTITIHEILAVQTDEGAFIGSISGILLFIAFVFCIQAKLGLVPFDMAEAETEINHGSFIEYSGQAYALIRLTRYMMLFILPAFLCTVLLGGLRTDGIHLLWTVLKTLGILLVLTLIRNTNPRVRIDQAMRFFFIWMNLLVIAAIILDYFNL